MMCVNSWLYRRKLASSLPTTHDRWHAPSDHGSLLLGVAMPSVVHHMPWKMSLNVRPFVYLTLENYHNNLT